MRPRTHILSVLVVLALALGAQLAYTDVGREVGGNWAEPAELSTLTDGSTTGYPDVAAAGAGDSAVVAWIETEAGDYRVRVARLRDSPDGVTVAGTRTILQRDQELREIDVSLRDGRVAVGVENAAAERITLLRGDAAGGEFAETTVTTDVAARVESVDVALLPARTAVAWRAYEDGGFAGRLALVGPVAAGDGDVPVQTRTIPSATTGRNSPALAAVGDGDLAVAWASDENSGVHLAVGSPGGDLDGRRIADARRGASSFSSANLPPVVDVTAGRDAGATSVLAWTDLSVVHVAVGESEPASFGSGSRLRVAGDAADWTAIWTVADRTSGRDLVYVRSSGADGSLERGHVSRFPSNTLAATIAAVGGDPVVAWVEQGGDRRLLVSGYTGDGPVGPVGRLTTTPLRFGFVSAVAAIIAVVTVPLLPWVVGPLLGGFLVTTRVVLSTVGVLVSRFAGLFGRSVRPGAVRSSVQSVSAWIALAAFVPVNVALFAYFGRGGVVPGVQTIDPFGLSALALAATVALAGLRGTDSSWRLVFLYSYCQSVALWAAAAPAFL